MLHWVSSLGSFAMSTAGNKFLVIWKKKKIVFQKIYFFLTSHCDFPLFNNREESGCGSVGRAVASDTRVPRSSHRQILHYLYTVNCIEKTNIKKKSPRMTHFYKKKNSAIYELLFVPVKEMLTENFSEFWTWIVEVEGS